MNIGAATMQIRLAGLDDAKQIAEIYAPIVEHTHISFELAAPDADDMRERIRTYAGQYPWLVAVDDRVILGYAYATAHRSRACYRWSVDSSVYVAQNARGRGIGKALYIDLFERLKAQRYHNAFAGIALPNDASIALHRALGFTQVGIYREVGYKHGVWRDTSWWQLFLADAGAAPDEPLPVAANFRGRS